MEVPDMSELSKNVNGGCWEILSQAVEKINLKDGDTFVICDYAAEYGDGSFANFVKVLKRIKEKFGEKQECMIIYDDLLQNDFNLLFHTLRKRREAYLTNPAQFPNNVFTMATAMSFHEQCAPSNSVHLAYSALAMHWLSKRPCPIKDSVHSWTSSSTDVQEQFRLQAERDWERLLVLRGKELAHDGQLVIQLEGRASNGEFGGGTKTIPVNFFTNFDALLDDMVQDGTLTEEEVMGVLKHYYPRTEEEISKPFKCSESAVYKLGLRLNHVEMKIYRCHFNKQWTEPMERAELEKSVKDYIASIRSWTAHRWLAGMQQTRPLTERMAIVDKIYEQYEKQILANPSHYGYDCLQALVWISKVA